MAVRRSTSKTLTVLALMSAACSERVPDDTPVPVEIFSWWSSKSERAALGAVLDVHEEKHPKVRVINAAEELAEDARARLADRMRRGLPPDTFQANSGRDLFQWVLSGDRDDSETKVAALNTIAEDNDWFSVFAEPVVDALSYQGRMYAVPLDIHRLNTLYYNVHVLEEVGIEPPRTLGELHSVLDVLVEHGYEAPLSIGNRYDWTMSLFAMENLFPSLAGPDFYEGYWSGRYEPEHDKMKAVLNELLSLWPYFNRDAMEIDWTVGVERLFADEKSNRSAFTVMGDWAKGHLQSQGYEPGIDFGSVPFPGSQGTFVFTADCFPLPKGAPHREDVVDLLVTFGSKKGQVAFSALKGSLPARVDIDPKKDLDSLARVTWEDFRSDVLVSALSGLLDTDFAEALAAAVTETLVDEDPDPVLFALRNNL